MPEMIPYEHQVAGASLIAERLREFGLFYTAWEERTGKTLTAILAMEQLKVERVLVITKKKPLDGWRETLAAYPVTKDYTVTNYHQVKNLKGAYDIVICDESHNYISGFPKPSGMWKEVRKFTKGKPILYLSATPCSQGYGLLFHQFKLSDWSPWESYTNFYNWHRVYGEPYSKYLHGRAVPKYDKVDDERVWTCVEHLFDFKTRKELGFEHEPVDELHHVTLSDHSKHIYNTIVDDRVYQFAENHELIGDTITKVRYALHMLEGGVSKVDDVYLVLDNTEKVDYILDKWGDSEDVVIMYQFIAERTKLEQHFKKATILQGTSNAEGIDLKAYKHLIIYSQDYSTARHSQRRARQANKARLEPITVHFLLVEGAISSEVYQTVALNKSNYIDSLYEGRKL